MSSSDNPVTSAISCADMDGAEYNASFVLWRFRLFSGAGSQVQPSTVEVNGVNEVLLIAESARRVLNPLDLGVDRFTGCVGDSMPKIGDDVGESALEHARHLDHRL